MSDSILRKAPVITVEPEAKSKNLEMTKDKYSSAKAAPKISVGTKAIDKSQSNEFSIQDSSGLKKLRITSSSEGVITKAATQDINTKPKEIALKAETLKSKITVPAPEIRAHKKTDMDFTALP